MKSRSTAVKVLVVVLALTLVGSSAAFLASRGPSGRDVVVTVDGHSITRDELYERMYSEVGDSVLDTLMVEALVKQEARRQGVEVTEDDMERAFARFISYFGSEQAFHYALAYHNISLEQLEQDMKIQILAEKCLADRVEITNEDVEEFFDVNRAAFGMPERVTASHILVSTEAEALDVIDRLKAGEAFEDLAEALSQDPGSRNLGGSLGTFGPGDMTPEFESAAFTLAVGEISDPVETLYGYHVIRVEERHDEVVPDLAGIWDEVEAEVRSQKTSALIPGWIDELRAAADIRFTGN